MTNRFLGAGATLLCLAGMAKADTFTYMANYGPAVPNYTQNVSLDKYHGNLADLISVRVELGVNIQGGFLCVDNDGADPASVTVDLGATSAISSMDVTLLDNMFQPVTGTAAASTGDTFLLAGDNGDGEGNVVCTAPDGATHIGGMDSDVRAGFINVLFHSGFVGPGTFNVTINANQILDFGSVGGVEGSFSPVNAAGYVKVTYEDVPEPATLALLGLGSLALIRRRRA